MTTTSPSDWAADVLDWVAMTEPTTFHTTLSHAKALAVVVVTVAEDFPEVAARWATAVERSAWFSAIGLVHITEVELVRLPPEVRWEALARLGGVGRDEPRARASKIAKAVREARAAHPDVPPPDPLPRAEIATYLRLLAVRACRPYAGLARMGRGSSISPPTCSPSDTGARRPRRGSACRDRCGALSLSKSAVQTVVKTRPANESRKRQPTRHRRQSLPHP
jgi:hypothetical protein